MRSLWIGGIVLVALFSAGCSSSGSSSGTTTTVATASSGSATTGAVSKSTTGSSVPASITATSKDKKACAAYATLLTDGPGDKQATEVRIQETLTALKAASNPQLQADAKKWAVGVYSKSKTKTDRAQKKIANLCRKMGLG
jgi:hypothetical protein